MSNFMAWFKGKPSAQVPAQPVVIPTVDRAQLFGPEHYDADDELVQAVNAALLLGMPLLLTGEPGTGKTQLAEKLALELGLGEPLKFETKSSSTAAELFYSFDHVRRFQAAHPGAREGDLAPLRFIEYGPLGRAILMGLPASVAASWFYQGQLPAWCQLPAPRRAVVLVDEIDKAPSDFPNDALNEVERHYVRVRELGEDRVLQADAAMRPIIVITSNSEKQLPDAFLRRCVFHHVQPMSAEKLKAVTLKRLGAWAQGLAAGPLLDDAVALYFELRDEPLPGARRASVRFELRKKPATAEFLAFVGALVQSGASMQQGLTPALARPWLSTLVKSAEDWEAAAQHRLLRKPA